MSTSSFWAVIADYNSHTLVFQGILLVLILGSLWLVYTRHLYALPKITLGICCLFIGIVFFWVYGKEPIQTYFAAPLFILSGVLFLYESKVHRTDPIIKPGIIPLVLFGIVLLYPLFSYLLGNVYPATVLLIMPCPVASLCILIYSCYVRRNRLLLLLLVIWGLTGVKSVFFNAYEDLILLLCGFYGIYLLITAIKNKPDQHIPSAQ